MMRLRFAPLALALLVAMPLGTTSSQAQDAKTLRSQANSEPNQEKQVQLLCKAADVEPKNKEFRRDCDVSKAALINSDKQALKTALDANDAGQAAKAKRYAKYVSSLDPDTHHQAEQLLAKLNAADTAPAAATPSAPAAPNQSALLAQAFTAYDSGNLQAAKTAAQGITDPSVKPAASRILSDIDRYSGYVSEGQHHEQAKEYADAEHSYQAALAVNAHVSSDDLLGKTQHMHQLAAASPQHSSALVAGKDQPKLPVTAPKIVAGKPQIPELSPDEKKKRLLDEGAQAMARNDLDSAGKKYKQVLDIDSTNADATHGLALITTALSKDPVLLEKTLREAITAFYASQFEDAESRLNRYLGADGGKKKGAAYFYLGATEATVSFLDEAPKRASRKREAQDDFKQARSAGYQPVDKYVSARVLEVWKGSGM